MNYLVRKVEVATGKEVLDIIHQSDTDIPASDLPCTIATAFVDANYPNIAPYFSDYAQGAAWVQAQIGAGASMGNVIITSDQDVCDLIENVNIWIAPNVTLNSVSGDNIHDVFIDGYGRIGDLTLSSCNVIDFRARFIGSIRLTASSYIKATFSECQSTTVYSGDNIDITNNGNGGTLSVDGEALVDVSGNNGIFSSITVQNNSKVRGRNFRVLGKTINGTACYVDFQNCEFYRATGIAIESIGEMSLTNCWVYSGDDYGIKINDGLSSPMTTIINNTMIWAGSSYSIYDNNTSGNIAPVHIYGESCSNKAMYHCDAVVRGLWSGASFKYKVY